MPISRRVVGGRLSLIPGHPFQSMARLSANTRDKFAKYLGARCSAAALVFGDSPRLNGQNTAKNNDLPGLIEAEAVRVRTLEYAILSLDLLNWLRSLLHFLFLARFS